jgi:hypothetical protein
LEDKEEAFDKAQLEDDKEDGFKEDVLVAFDD